LVHDLDQAYRVGVRQACSVLGFSHTSYYYKSIKVDDKALRQPTREIVQVRCRYRS